MSYESFNKQEGICEIPVPKWIDQGDDLVSHMKNCQILKIQFHKLLNFENSNFLNCHILKYLLNFDFKNVKPWPFHFGTGISIVKMASKFEILSLYSMYVVKILLCFDKYQYYQSVMLRFNLIRMSKCLKWNVTSPKSFWGTSTSNSIKFEENAPLNT